MSFLSNLLERLKMLFRQNEPTVDAKPYPPEPMTKYLPADPKDPAESEVLVEVDHTEEAKEEVKEEVKEDPGVILDVNAEVKESDVKESKQDCEVKQESDVKLEIDLEDEVKPDQEVLVEDTLTEINPLIEQITENKPIVPKKKKKNRK